MHPDLIDGAPDVVEMLRSWGFNIGVYSEVAAWMKENNSSSSNDAALWWLQSKSDIWSTWVTEDAAAAISAALAANEIPDGWPTE